MNDAHHCQELFVVASDFVEKSPGRARSAYRLGDHKIARRSAHAHVKRFLLLLATPETAPYSGGSPLGATYVKGEIR